MDSMLFHSDLFMPPCAMKPVFRGALQYGPHALKEARSDRYGKIDLPEEFTTAGAKLIEAEVLSSTNTVVKQVWRRRLDERRDLVLVIASNGFVRTVWVNLRNDKHGTLDKTKYADRSTWMARNKAKGQ